VVKEHNGTIDVESAIGGGTAFQVILPASEEFSLRGSSAPANHTALGNSSPMEGLAGRSALIVDDEESIREIVQEGLAARGMKIESAGTAEQALTLLAKNSYDVVLCDFNLPKLSGEQLFDQLTRQGGGLPRFVFMTGELVDAARIAAVGKKGASILQKPFRVPAVAKLLAELLQPHTSTGR
jgi:two-component system cell cycle sensor histidine kinase/response regulator CckA